jgi:hypothetical protein
VLEVCCIAAVLIAMCNLMFWWQQQYAAADAKDKAPEEVPLDRL